MAHEATSLELSPGVTVVSGPNNVGKSAIVEAMRYLLYNPAPKHVIRHGAKEAVVRLELDSGESIVWRRQEKNAAYSLQQPEGSSEEYHKFGREVPEDIRSLLRLEQVITDTGERIDIHLGNQREPIFLLDKPGSHAAGFFAASTEADYLLKMQQALKRRSEQAKRDQSRLREDLAEVTRHLAHLEPLADLELLIQEAEALYEAILATQRQLPVLQDLMAQLATMIDRLDRTKTMAGVLAALDTPPPLADISRLAQILTELRTRDCQQRQEKARDSVFIGLSQPPDLAPITALAQMVEAINNTQRELAGDRDQKQVLADLAAPPELLPTREIGEVIQALAETTDQWQWQTRRLTACQDLSQPPQLKLIGPLPQLILELTETAQHLANWQNRQEVLARTAPPPELVDLGPQISLMQELDNRNGQWQHHMDFLAVLATLPPPPDLDDLSELEKTLDLMSQGMANLNREQASARRLAQELESKKAEIQDYLLEVGACPLCGSPLEMSHFLEAGHA